MLSTFTLSTQYNTHNYRHPDYNGNERKKEAAADKEINFPSSGDKYIKPSAEKIHSEKIRNISYPLDTKNGFFIHDFLTRYGLNMGRESDIKEIFTYHANPVNLTISDAYRINLISEMLDICRETKEKQSNRFYIEKMQEWYRNAGPADLEVIQSDAVKHLNDKGRSIANMIFNTNPNIGDGSDKIRILDVGGNDGKLTSYVAKGLAEIKRSCVEPNVLEIETDTRWDQNSKEAQGARHKNCEPVRRITYDGTNMKTGKVNGSKSENPLIKDNFDCVMYQHSLHHFPSQKIQQDSLKQAAALLKTGGVLTLTEHASKLSNDQIDLMHAIIEIYKMLHEDPNIPADQLERTFDRYMGSETPANYMSQQLLITMAKQAGFTLISNTKTSAGPDHVYSINFQKASEDNVIKKKRELEALSDVSKIEGGRNIQSKYRTYKPANLILSRERTQSM